MGPLCEISSDDIECLFMHSETTLKGHLITSNPIVNQIQHNIQWTQLSNLMSIPTDGYISFEYSFDSQHESFRIVTNVMNVEDG